MKTKTKKTKTAISPLMPVDADVITEDDVKLMERLAKAKAKVKELDVYLKPRIAATVEAHGEGILLIGDRQVEFKRQVRNTTSWAALASAVIDPTTLRDHKPDYTVESTSYSAKVTK